MRHAPFAVFVSTLIVLSGVANADESSVTVPPGESQTQGADVQERGLSGPLIRPQSQVNPAVSAAAAAMAAQQAELDPKAMLARIKLLEKVISCMMAFDRYGSGASAALTAFPQLYSAEVIWAADHCH